jgi:hypothetical protein
MKIVFDANDPILGLNGFPVIGCWRIRIGDITLGNPFSFRAFSTTITVNTMP